MNSCIYYPQNLEFALKSISEFFAIYSLNTSDCFVNVHVKSKQKFLLFLFFLVLLDLCISDLRAVNFAVFSSDTVHEKDLFLCAHSPGTKELKMGINQGICTCTGQITICNNSWLEFP